MQEMIYCQSCGMALTSEEVKGMEKDGTKSQEYCLYCYKDGAFAQDITMEEMIEINLKYLDEWNKDSEEKVPAHEARVQLKEFLPKLKRWQ